MTKSESSTDIEDFDDIVENEDPLFGNLKDNEGLKTLLSPKKKKKKKEEEEKSSVTKRKLDFNDVPKIKRNKGMDVLEQLQAHMKDPLEKELGFSIKKSLKDPNKNLKKSRDFVNLLEEVNREREIKNIFSKQEEEENNEESIKLEINKWIDNHVCKEFLELKVDNVKVHGKWASHLKKVLKNLVQENGNKFDRGYIERKLEKNSPYFIFKCFTHKGLLDRKLRNISFIFGELNLTYLIESNDVRYVESFACNDNIKIEDSDHRSLDHVLNNLGFDVELLAEEKNLVRKRFDDKQSLAPLGCGFQVFKFVKLIDIPKVFEMFSKRETVKVLILMSVDYNVGTDMQRFYYRDGYHGGREVCMMKLKELGDVGLINELLKVLFRLNCPELWFEFLNNNFVRNDEKDRIMGSKLILKFLECVEINDDIKMQEEFENIEELETLFKIFNEFLKDMSGGYFKLEDEELSENLYMKVELVKDMILINNGIIEKWREEGDERYEELKKCINKIKNYYFKEYEQSFNSIIPKCKRILDFLYHELSGIEVGDFFVDEDV